MLDPFVVAFVSRASCFVVAPLFPITDAAVRLAPAQHA